MIYPPKIFILCHMPELSQCNANQIIYQSLFFIKSYGFFFHIFVEIEATLIAHKTLLALVFLKFPVLIDCFTAFTEEHILRWLPLILGEHYCGTLKSHMSYTMLLRKLEKEWSRWSTLWSCDHGKGGSFPLDLDTAITITGFR